MSIIASFMLSGTLVVSNIKLSFCISFVLSFYDNMGMVVTRPVSQVSSRLLSFFLNVLVARRLTREQFGVCVRTFFPLHHVLLMLLL